MQVQKDSRSTTSCTECQRRKQKCSREWPCNHCQSRKVPHLCQFGLKKTQLESPPSSTERGQKRSHTDSNEESSSYETSDEKVEDGLKAWGYMPGHVHYNLANLEPEDTSRVAPAPEVEQNQAVERVLHAVPPRTITDAFVNHFLSVVNYRYNTIYGPTFTEKYVQWWTDRGAGKRLSAEFTCLLLRILAYSVQYLTPQLRKMIEFELACDSQILTERFGAAAEQLSSTFTASKSSLERVQEQFMKGTWLKSESKIVESWHTLGATIREAQELGIDKNTDVEGVSQFEMEIRRRIWTLLYIWDWQMSAWLGRPHLIDQKDCTFEFPNLRLEESANEPNLLSPFAHIVLQAMLARRIAQHMGDVQVGASLSAEQIFAVEAECEAFIDDLPPVFKMDEADKTLDEKHPYYVFQRSQLHVVIYITQLDFLKPYLTRGSNDSVSTHDGEFRKMGIDLSLKLLQVARELFDHEFPINAKFHLVVFCIFDTATILCSALIHDVNKTLPRRQEVIEAVDGCLDMLHQLSLTTKIGASSYNFLFKLVQASPALAKYGPIRKRQRIDTTTTSQDEKVENGDTGALENVAAIAPPGPSADTAANGTIAAINPVLEPTTDDLSFDLDQFLQQNPLGDSAALDIGGLEQVWDWDNLHLDAFLHQTPPDQRSSIGP